MNKPFTDREIGLINGIVSIGASFSAGLKQQEVIGNVYRMLAANKYEIKHFLEYGDEADLTTLRLIAYCAECNEKLTVESLESEFMHDEEGNEYTHYKLECKCGNISKEHKLWGTPIADYEAFEAFIHMIGDDIKFKHNKEIAEQKVSDSDLPF